MVDDPLSTAGESTSGTKPNFIGKVVRTALNDEDQPSEFESDKPVIDLLWEIEVLGIKNEDGGFEKADWKNQTTRWVTVSNTVMTNPPSVSKWMVVVWNLQQIYPDLSEEAGATEAESIEEYVELFLEWLEGKTFEFQELDWTEDEPEMNFTAVTSGTAGNDTTEVTVTPAMIGEASSQEMNEFIVAVGEPDDDTVYSLTGEVEDDVDDVEEVDIEEL